MSAQILIADDMEENRVILQTILEDSYILEMAEDGQQAYEILQNGYRPALILSDVVMPRMDGYQFLAKVKAHPELKTIPVIFITATGQEDESLAAGAIDFIAKPFNPDIVKLRVANQIELSTYRESLEKMVVQKARELIANKEVFLETMATMIEYRNLESGEHIRRTKELTEILVKQLLNHPKYGYTLSQAHPSSISRAAALHDIGKIGIPDHILLKPGKLTPDEFKIIESHAVIGGEMVKTMMLDDNDEYLQHCYDIARHHHERWDGKGYPDKLSGEQIPLSARIVALVDVYDALVSKRCYKNAMAHEQAMEIIKEEEGTHFDVEIVKALIDAEKQVKKLYSF